MTRIPCPSESWDNEGNGSAEFEAVCEWLEDKILNGIPPAICIDWLSEEIANSLACESQDFVEVVETHAMLYCRDKRKRERDARRLRDEQMRAKR